MPNSCQLSAGLKILVTPLLAGTLALCTLNLNLSSFIRVSSGLMEVDPRKRLSFDNFFAAVQNVLCRKRVHIFFVNKIQSLRVYMDLEEHKTLTNFQCLIMGKN